MGTVNRRRQIHGAGTAPVDWERWLDTRRIPDLDPLRADQRLVVVAPHPDDELLACGGLLAAHASQGGEWCLVAVTDGEASHGGDIDPKQLAQRRRSERDEGLAEMGLSNVGDRTRRLALADGAVARSTVALMDGLLNVLSPGDVVVSTWRFDGHPDHETTGGITAMACEVRRCSLLEAPVWMWHWATPGDVQVPWHRLRRVRLGAELGARKRAAVLLHVSQLEERPGGQGPVLGDHILARAAWPVEYFFS